MGLLLFETSGAFVRDGIAKGLPLDFLRGQPLCLAAKKRGEDIPMLPLATKPIDPTKVRTVVYHLPEGETVVIDADGLEDFFVFPFGRVCDTSEINGVVHVYPIGTA